MASITVTGRARAKSPKRGPPPLNNNGVMPKSILKKVSCTGKLTHSRKLTFHNKKKTKRIPNVNSMPEDILEDIWWAADDYDEIMRSFEYTVFMMEAGEAKTVDDDNQHCTRGLELRTEAGKWARFENKRDCYNAVLDEQDRQWNAGEDNQEKIANCCREVTAKTQRIACRKGMQDEKEISEFVADVRSLISGGNSGSRTRRNSNGSKNLPSRTKSTSTGSLKKRTPRTDSGKARREKSPPKKPERVLSGKSERGEVTPQNSAVGAPRTPKRSVSSKSSESSKNSAAVTPSNSARIVQRMPQRQTFSNNSNSPSSRSSPSRTNSSTNKAKKKKSANLPKIPKRSASNSSTLSNASTCTDKSNASSCSDGKGKLNMGALAKFGG